MDPLVPLDSVISEANKSLAAGRRAGARVWPTGFAILDEKIGGGLRSGELTLLGGPQGLGKTTLALQMLRNVLTRGYAALYFSFEHEPAAVLERLLGLESGLKSGYDAVPLRLIREAMEAVDNTGATLEDRLKKLPGGAEALGAVQAYSARLVMHRSRGSTTSLAVLEDKVKEAKKRFGEPPVVVVDYLQKVFVPRGSEVEDERVTTIVEGLKDLALTEAVPLLTIVAADKQGIASGKRLRVHNLRGSSALAYEADIILVLNEKYDVVARHHLVYDSRNVERFKAWAVLSIEKNRSGVDGVELEFRKQFDQGHFDPEGGVVEEQLVDERIFVE